MVRITIETDVGGVTVAQPDSSQTAFGVAPGAAGQDSPPADLAARAAASGASSAGPAPEGPPSGAGVPGFQQVGPGAPGTPPIDATAPGGALAAGAAPTGGVEGVEVDEEE